MAFENITRSINKAKTAWERLTHIAHDYEKVCDAYRRGEGDARDALTEWHTFAAVPKAAVRESLSLKGDVERKLELLLSLEPSPSASRLRQSKDRIEKQIDYAEALATGHISNDTNAIAVQIRRHADSYLGDADAANATYDSVLAPAEAAADRLAPIGTNERLYSPDTLDSILEQLNAACGEKLSNDAEVMTALEHPAVLEWLEDVDRSDKRKTALEARHRAELALQWASDDNERLAAIIDASSACLLKIAPEGECSAEQRILTAIDELIAEPTRAAIRLGKAADTLSKNARHAFGVAAKSIQSRRDNALSGVPKWSAESLTAVVRDAAPDKSRSTPLPTHLALMAARAQSKLRRLQDATTAAVAKAWTAKVETLLAEAQTLERDLSGLKAWSESALTALANSIHRDLRALVDLVLEDLINAWIESNQRDPLERSWEFRRRLVQMQSWSWRALSLEGYGLDAQEHVAIGAAVKTVTARGTTAYEADVWLKLFEDSDLAPRVHVQRKSGERR